VKHAGVVVVAFAVVGHALAQDEELPQPKRWHLFGDAIARGDFVRDFPSGRDDLDRGRLRVRSGVRRTFGPAWELGASIRGSLGTDENEDNALNLDNEKTNDFGVDRLFVRWYGGHAGEIRVGQAELAHTLAPLVWDADLRPIGASYAGTWSVRTLDTLALRAGCFHPNHPLEGGTDSRLALVQADWRIREGARTSGALTLSYAWFDDIDHLVSSDLARTNRVEEGRYTSEFELLDLQGVARTGSERWPISLVLDSVVNLGAASGDEDWGGQALLIAGNHRHAGAFELAVAAERIQRDAVLAAFNSDDWWFRSATRGVRAWVAYGLRDDLWLRLSGSSERPDGADDRLHRLLLELSYLRNKPS
jgi:hypothetical protein